MAWWIMMCILAAWSSVTDDALTTQMQRWLDADRPFMLGPERKEELAILEPFEAATAAVLTATDEYETVRTTFLKRISVIPSDAPVQMGYLEAAHDWKLRTSVIGLNLKEAMRVALPPEQFDAWHFRASKFRYKKVIESIHSMNVGVSIPILFDILDNARVSIEHDDPAYDTLVVHTHKLCDLANTYDRDWARRRFLILKDDNEIKAAAFREWTLAGHAALSQSCYDAVSALCEHLPINECETVRATARCTRIPALCAPTPMEVAIRQLVAFDGLEVTERERIEQITARYVEERALLVPVFFDAQVRWDSPPLSTERDRKFDSLHAQGQNGYEAWTSHPGLPALRSLYALEVSTCRSLASVFEGDRWEALPKHLKLALSWE